jgi:hypothetical protein
VVLRRLRRRTHPYPFELTSTLKGCDRACAVARASEDVAATPFLLSVVPSEMPGLAALPAHAYSVVFDLGGVLIDWNPRHLYRKMFDDPIAMERFLGMSVLPNGTRPRMPVDRGPRPWTF